MAKQLNVDMRFNADANQAKSVINDLTQALEKLSRVSTSTPHMGLTNEIRDAQTAAAQLKITLEQAFNTDTGKLDLGKFTESLRKSGMSLSDYKTKLTALGPEGTKAFSQLAQSIATSEVQLRKSNTLLNEFWTTLKNTARWQISSSILHGFMGTLQSAKYYAQDLNESLNNIRIVTGHSVDQMARFASEANKAARELSTTTTAYTDASLIFYQQGLNDEEVAARTQVTIKMANAAGESAQKVSDQLTAVWNNFYDGSHSLEYYADVMTALGAATASSTDEIAAGIEKFASVAQTIGLSYDYAASALATVTATTRQSADTVGTAFKTLFSRMQGLKLGETLEDGTDLTKYSAALKVVGVDIKTANGDLRDMDDILEDLGAKWQLLTRDQKVATAQTVAGVRQYNQLMALMENWDFFQENLTIAKGSEGTLTEQAKIYAESWEAARNRVKAAAEDIYGALLDDKFFISIDNTITHLLNAVSDLVKGFGGLPGVIALIGTTLTSVFGSQISKSIDNMLSDIRQRTAMARNEMVATKAQAIRDLEALAKDQGSTSAAVASQAFQSQSIVSKTDLEFQLKTKGQISEVDKAIAEELMKQHNQLVQNTIDAGKELEKQEDIYKELVRQQELLAKRVNNRPVDINAQQTNFEDLIKQGGKLDVNVMAGQDNTAAFAALKNALDELQNKASAAKQTFEEFTKGEYGAGAAEWLVRLNAELNKAHPNASNVLDILSAIQTLPGPKTAIENFKAAAAELEKLTGYQGKIASLDAALKNIKFNPKTPQDIALLKSRLDALQKAVADAGKTMEEAFGKDGAKAVEDFSKALETGTATEDQFNKMRDAVHTGLQNINDEVEQGKEKLHTAMSNMFGSDGAKQGIRDMDEALTGLTEAQDNVITSTEAMEAAQARYAEHIARLKTQVATFGQGLVALGSVLSSTAMAINAIKGVAQIWTDKDATVMEKILTTMTAIGTVTMALTRALNEQNIARLKGLATAPQEIANHILAAAAEKMRAKAIAEGMAVEQAGIVIKVEDNVVTNTLTGSTLGLAGAIKVLIASMGPVAWIIAGVTAAVVGLSAALIAIDKNKTEAIKEAAVRAREQADASLEAAKATREQTNAYEDALSVYESAKKAYEEGTISADELKTAQDNLASAAKTVTTTLDIQGASLAELTGDYDSLTESIRAATHAQLENAREDAANAQTATGREFVTSMYEGAGRRNGAGGYYFDTGVSLANNNLSQYMTGNEKYIHTDQSSLWIATPDRKTETMIQAYEEAMAIQEKMLKMARESGDESIFETKAYKNLTSWLEKSSEAYETYMQYGKEIKALDLELSTIEAMETIKRVSSQEEYVDAENRLIEILAKKRKLISDDQTLNDLSAESYADLQEEVRRYLGTMENTQPYVTVEKALDDISEQTGRTREEIQAFREELEKLGLIDFSFAADYSPGTTEADWMRDIAHAQANAGLTEIGTQKEAAQSGIDLLGTKGTSAQDVAAWAQSFNFDQLNELLGRQLDWKQFLMMPADDQQAILEQYQHMLDLQEIATMQAIATQDEAVKTQAETVVAELTQIIADWETANNANFEATRQNLNELLELALTNTADLTEEQSARLQDLREQYAEYFKEDGTIDLETLQASVDQFNELNGSLEYHTGLIASLTAEMEQYNAATEISILNAKSLGELWEMTDSGASAEQYALGLAHLAQQYESCESELTRFNHAMENGNDATKEESQAMLELSVRAAELAEAYDLSAESIEAYAKQYKDLFKDQNVTSKALAEMAKDQLRFDKAVESSIKSYDDWTEALKMGAEGALIAADTLNEIADAYGNLLDIDPDILPSSFLKSAENLELMKQAMEGSEEAYFQLQSMAGQEIMTYLGIDDTDWLTEYNYLQNLVADTNGNRLLDLEAGANLDDANFLAALDELINSVAMTVDEATSLLSSMGVDAEIVQQTETRPKLSTYTSANPIITMEEFDGTNPVTNATEHYSVPHINWQVEQVPIEGQTEEVAMGLHVTSANKSSGGNVKSSGSAPLRSNGGSAVPQKKTGGGGGGGSNKEVKHADKKSDSEKERYHTLLNQLEDLSAAYDRVSKAADRAFGKDKLRLIDGEIEATDDLIKKQEEYIDAIQKNLPTDRAIMEAYAQKLLGFGISYDESGNIANFDALQDAMYAVYNARADAMDSSSVEWQVFEKEFEQLEHWIEQYEETYDLLRDEQDKLQEYLDQQTDLQLKKIQYAIELKLNVADDSLAVLNYQLDRLEDKAFSAAEAIALMGSKVDVLYDKVAADREGLDKVLGQQLSSAEIQRIYEGDMSVLNDKHFTEDQIAAIKEYRDDLLSLNEELLEVRKSVQEKVMDTFDEFNEKLEDQIDLFDHYNAILTNYKNIIDIVGRSYLKVDKELMKTLNQATINNAINKVKGTKDAYDALVVSQAEAEKALQEAIARGNEIDIAAWEKDLEEIQKKVNDAQENMMQAWEDALQSCAEMFEMAVEDAIDNFNKAMLPFGSLEEFQDAYDKQKEVADQYLEDYDKIYELSKLARNVNNSINDAPNIAGKQKLAKLLEKINKYQEDGVEMSKYDLEYLQKEYDLRLAEIALEEAQNAKSVVRLTRDNEGNYSYSYTADSSAVDDAAQKYEDALHAMQELSSNYIDEMSDQLIDATQKMEEELAAVRVEDYASIEDYYKKIDEIQQYWLDRMGYMQNEFQKALDNNKTLYEQDWQRYADATGYKISADEDFAKSYQDTVLGKLFDSEDDIIDFQQRVNDALGDSDRGLIGELLAAYIQWQENTEHAMEAAGTSSEGFAEHMEEAVSGPSGIIDQSQAATDAVDNMATQMIAGFTSVIGAVDQWQSHYSDTMDSIIQKNMDVIEAHNLLVKALSTGDSTTSTSGSSSSSGSSSNSSGSSGASSSGSGSGGSGSGGVAGSTGGNSELSVGSYVDVKSGTKWYADSWGGAPWGWARSGTIQYTADGNPLAYNIEGLGWIRKSDIVGYGSGGYTGEWGPAGKLAMLHEKELVLNPEDSANFLSAIEMVRDFSRYIDLQAQWQSTGLGALVASAIKETDNTLQQQVSITADFPNVSDRNEIEAAFNSLVNTAAQYANRKNPLSGIV